MWKRKGVLFFVVFLLSIDILLAKNWQDLFDKKSLKGWRKMAVHGGRGGVWVVEKGILVGDQDIDHTGGLLGTEKRYSDFEIELEFQADYPVDSGLFLRTREDGMGYQITIDYREEGYVGSLYSPAEGRFLAINPHWEKVYRKKGWNRLRVRIEGQPAHIHCWLNGRKMFDFRDGRARYPREGYIGLQVHGGAGSWGEKCKIRFRNIRLKELKEEEAKKEGRKQEVSL